MESDSVDVVWLQKGGRSPTWPRHSNGHKEKRILQIPSIKFSPLKGLAEDSIVRRIIPSKLKEYEILVSTSRLPKDYTIHRRYSDFRFLSQRLPKGCSKLPGTSLVQSKTALVEDPRRKKIELWLQSIENTHHKHPELIRFLSPAGYAKMDFAPAEEHWVPEMFEEAGQNTKPESEKNGKTSFRSLFSRLLRISGDVQEKETEKSKTSDSTKAIEELTDDFVDNLDNFCSCFKSLKVCPKKGVRGNLSSQGRSRTPMKEGSGCVLNGSNSSESTKNSSKKFPSLKTIRCGSCGEVFSLDEWKRHLAEALCPNDKNSEGEESIEGNDEKRDSVSDLSIIKPSIQSLVNPKPSLPNMNALLPGFTFKSSTSSEFSMDLGSEQQTLLANGKREEEKESLVVIPQENQKKNNIETSKPVKRKRGRPRKLPLPSPDSTLTEPKEEMESNGLVPMSPSQVTPSPSTPVSSPSPFKASSTPASPSLSTQLSPPSVPHSPPSPENSKENSPNGTSPVKTFTRRPKRIRTSASVSFLLLLNLKFPTCPLCGFSVTLNRGEDINEVMSKHMDEDCAGEPLLSGPDAREMIPADGPFQLLDSPRRKKKALQDSLKALEVKQKKRKRYSDDSSDSSSSDSSQDEEEEDDNDEDEDDGNVKEAKKEKKKEKKSEDDTVGCDWIGRLIRREGERKYYFGLRLEREDYYAGDCATFQSGGSKERPYLAQDGEMFVECQWYFFGDDTCDPSRSTHDNEVFLGEVKDSNSVGSMIAKAQVYHSSVEFHRHLNQEEEEEESELVFFCNTYYNSKRRAFRKMEVETNMYLNYNMEEHVTSTRKQLRLERAKVKILLHKLHKLRSEGNEEVVVPSKRGKSVPVSQDLVAQQNSQRKLPKNWPSNIVYTPKLIWDDVPNDVKRIVYHDFVDDVQIRRITDPDHPARGQFGLFSTNNFGESKIVGEYTGRVNLTSDKASNKRYLSILYENRTFSLDIDAGEYGNEMRFINDYRGITSAPNIKYQRMKFGGTWHIMVVTKRKIKKGTELLVDYGDTYWENLDSKGIRWKLQEKKKEKEKK